LRFSRKPFSHISTLFSKKTLRGRLIGHTGTSVTSAAT
jgi:hypothetical protein